MVAVFHCYLGPALLVVTRPLWPPVNLKVDGKQTASTLQCPAASPCCSYASRCGAIMYLHGTCAPRLMHGRDRRGTKRKQQHRQGALPTATRQQGGCLVGMAHPQGDSGTVRCSCWCASFGATAGVLRMSRRLDKAGVSKMHSSLVCDALPGMHMAM
jgi:hypothetical protein